MHYRNRLVLYEQYQSYHIARVSNWSPTTLLIFHWLLKYVGNDIKIYTIPTYQILTVIRIYTDTDPFDGGQASIASRSHACNLGYTYVSHEILLSRIKYLVQYDTMYIMLSTNRVPAEALVIQTGISRHHNPLHWLSLCFIHPFAISAPIIVYVRYSYLLCTMPCQALWNSLRYVAVFALSTTNHYTGLWFPTSKIRNPRNSFWMSRGHWYMHREVVNQEIVACIEWICVKPTVLSILEIWNSIQCDPFFCLHTLFL